MRVSDILRTKGSAVCTISGTASVAEAIEALDKFGIGAIVVSSNGTAVEGILSERDIVRSINRLGKAVLGHPVSDVMTADVVTCRSQEQVDYMMSVMTEHRFRHVPVVQSGELVGIISIGDVVASRVGELEREAEALEQYLYHGR